jgi:hypothetical protein
MPTVPVHIAVPAGLVAQLLHRPKQLTLDSGRLPADRDPRPPERACLLGVLHVIRVGAGMSRPPRHSAPVSWARDCEQLSLEWAVAVKPRRGRCGHLVRAEEVTYAGAGRWEFFPVGQADCGQQAPALIGTSRSTLVTNVHKLINGKSVFGVIGDDRVPVDLGIVVVDAAQCHPGHDRGPVPADRPRPPRGLRRDSGPVRQRPYANSQPRT